MPENNRPGFGLTTRPVGDEAHRELLVDVDQDGEERGQPRPGRLQRQQTMDRPGHANPYSHLPIYLTIHQIRRDVIASIDDPYSLEQLKTPRVNISIVRPLVDRLYEKNDISTVYCLLVNRVQFLREQSDQAQLNTVHQTRARLCEIVAQKILRRFDEDNEGPEGLLLLANILVAGFSAFQGAPEEVLRDNSDAMDWSVQKLGGYEAKLTALEVAIVSESKSFLSSTSCVKVTEAIYKGRIIYTPSSFFDIIPDHYKYKPIVLYDPSKAPLLNQYRLIVPRTRNIMEVCQFIILLILYVLAMEKRDGLRFTGYELCFAIYAFGWVLDQFATILEHGWQVYTENLWAFLDVFFAAVYAVYLIFRISGYATGNTWYDMEAVDVLAIGAPVLVPRLAFNLMSENMLFVSLRAMMKDFLTLTVLAVWCFAGFLLSLYWLCHGRYGPTIISEWMLWVWFGLDGTGIKQSPEFHWILGPFLMVSFAFLGNTLFLTILVSMLSNTFATIVANANAEVQFRRTVLTFEGVKSDAIFAYQPPFNILALLFMLPLNLFVSQRWFHKINVAIVRTLNLPILLIIGYYERKSLWPVEQGNIYSFAKPRSTLQSWGLSRFSVHRDIHAVFDSEPPQSTLDQIAFQNHLTPNILVDGIPLMQNETDGSNHPPPSQQPFSSPSTPKLGMRNRKESMDLFAAFSEYMPGLHDAGGNDRFEVLEKGMARIEAMLKTVLENDEAEDEAEVEIP